MKEFWLDMAFSVLLAALRQGEYLEKYRRAFRKVFVNIGLSFGWPVEDEVKSKFPQVLP